MTAWEWKATAATAILLATAGRAIAAPPPPPETSEISEQDLRDTPGDERRDDEGMWLAAGSFGLMSFMVYRWISEDEQPAKVYRFDGPRDKSN